MRTANPALNDKTFSGVFAAGDATAMTLTGTAVKTGLLLLFTVTASTFTWKQVQAGDLRMAIPLAIGGMIGGFIVALITVFRKQWSPVTAPLYAILEGLFLGAVSAIYDLRFPGTGIVGNAVGLTFGTLACLLAAYVTGIVKPSENFKLGIVAATGGIMMVYLVSIVLRLFGIEIPLIHGSGWIGIGFSLFVVVIAALNLVLDFDFIEKGVESRAPKYMEWYAGFGLLVTLVWLYLEILRLLAKLNSRRN
ncbi:MAG: Bax inhibitor-1/YccA family protein [Candidatus Brocadiae bacterium]|nr:Bax inhibitor-1/YccA family protein [Candidatus Brocadiia bacterium]